MEMVKLNSYCSISKLLKILGTEWTAHIIFILAEHETMRHNQLKTHLTGISSKVITERLRLLEAEGLIERTEDGQTANSVSYSLSPSGILLHSSLENLESVCENLKD